MTPVPHVTGYGFPNILYVRVEDYIYKIYIYIL